jgi:hypothetical protein
MVQLLFLDLHQMNRLAALAHDPLIGSYLAELDGKVSQRSKAILSGNKKGIALARALEKLPDVKPSSTDADQARIRIGTAEDLDDRQLASLYQSLRDLKPWRKGPFEIFGIRIDSEWESSIKWNRLAGHLGSLAGKRVLEGNDEMALFPEKRYAKMNNIFFIPTVACLTHRLTRSGFDDIQCVDISRTTSQEQRKLDVPVQRHVPADERKLEHLGLGYPLERDEQTEGHQHGQRLYHQCNHEKRLKSVPKK